MDASSPSNNRARDRAEGKPVGMGAAAATEPREGNSLQGGSEPRTGLRRSLSPPIERLISGDSSSNSGNNNERSVDSGGDFEMVSWRTRPRRP